MVHVTTASPQSPHPLSAITLKVSKIPGAWDFHPKDLALSFSTSIFPPRYLRISSVKTFDNRANCRKLTEPQYRHPQRRLAWSSPSPAFPSPKQTPQRLSLIFYPHGVHPRPSRSYCTPPPAYMYPTYSRLFRR